MLGLSRCAGFFLVSRREQGLLSSCYVRAFHCCGFSSCRAQALRQVGFRIQHVGLVVVASGL